MLYKPNQGKAKSPLRKKKKNGKKLEKMKRKKLKKKRREDKNLNFGKHFNDSVDDEQSECDHESHLVLLSVFCRRLRDSG